MRVLAGYLGSVFFATALVFLVEVISTRPASMFSPEQGFSTVIGVYLFWTVLVGLFATIPFFLIISPAEAYRIRSPSYYAIWATLLGIFLGVISFPLHMNHYKTINVLAVLGVIGFLAGLVYWFLSGRHAGPDAKVKPNTKQDGYVHLSASRGPHENECGLCGRPLEVDFDPLSGDSGGDCWGCIGKIEAENFDPEGNVSKEYVAKEITWGWREADGTPKPQSVFLSNPQLCEQDKN